MQLSFLNNTMAVRGVAYGVIALGLLLSFLDGRGPLADGLVIAGIVIIFFNMIRAVLRVWRQQNKKPDPPDASA